MLPLIGKMKMYIISKEFKPVRIGSKSTEHWPSTVDFSSSFFFLSFAITSTTVTTTQMKLFCHNVEFIDFNVSCNMSVVISQTVFLVDELTSTSRNK